MNNSDQKPRKIMRLLGLVALACLTTPFISTADNIDPLGTPIATSVEFAVGTEDKFYLETNGVTIKCETASVGEKGTVNGVEYEAVDRALLIQRRDEGADLTKVCTSKVTDMSELFKGTPTERNTFNLTIGNWDVGNVANMDLMFENSDFNQSVEYWDVSNVTTMVGMFRGSYFDHPIGSWNVANVTKMPHMFEKSPFNQTIGGWNVSNVTSMYGMFSESQFDQPISDWVVSKLVDMRFMFARSPFNQPIGNWNVSNVEYMYGLFEFSQFNQPLSNWDVSNVKLMRSLFLSTPFNQNISGWDVSSVTDMSVMFANSSFNQPIGNWNVSNVTNMSEMFKNSQFNQPIGDWDVKNVTTMSSMFFDAISFNQDLGDWDYSSITQNGLIDFIANSGLNPYQYDQFLKKITANSTYPTGIVMNSTGLRYCIGSVRDLLISIKNVTLVGDQQWNDCQQTSNFSSDLIAFYPFNGNANNASSADLQGQVEGAQLTSDRFGVENTAYEFEDEQRIIISGSGGMNLFPITISLWVNISTISLANIFKKYEPATWNGYAILVDGSGEGNSSRIVPWYLRNTSNKVIGQYGEPRFESPASTGEWVHVVFVIDELGGRIYNNGEFVDYHPWTGNFGPPSSGYLWQIGGKYQSGESGFSGKIDDVRVYNRGLLPQDILALYDQEYNFPTALPKLEPVALSQSAFINQQYQLDVQIGGDVAVQDLYGVSFKLRTTNANTSYVDDSAVKGSFLGNGVLEFFRKVDTRTVELSVTKTAAPGVSGTGVVASASFVSTQAGQVSFELFDVEAINSQGNPIPLSIEALNLSVAAGLCVYPGDTNNDTVINGADLIPIGLYYGQTIGQSNTPSLNMQCQVRSPWAADESTPRRIYADANGSGTIDAADVLAIGLNYGKPRPAPAAPSKIAAEESMGQSTLGLRMEHEWVGATSLRLDVHAQTSLGLQGASFALTMPTEWVASTGSLRIDTGRSMLGRQILEFAHLNTGGDGYDLSLISTGVPHDRPGEGLLMSVLVEFDRVPGGSADFGLTATDWVDARGQWQRPATQTVTHTVAPADGSVSELPHRFALEANFPNPFNPSTQIRYQLAEDSPVRLEVYTLTGSLIKVLVDARQSRGTHQVGFDASGLSSGVYLYRLTTQGFTQTNKMVLVK